MKRSALPLVLGVYGLDVPEAVGVAGIAAGEAAVAGAIVGHHAGDADAAA
jgi:hypothetical protein